MIEEMSNQWLHDEYVIWWWHCGHPINHAEFFRVIKIKYDVKVDLPGLPPGPSTARSTSAPVCAFFLH